MVHFIATDDQGARCTDSVNITVGSITPPPTTDMAPQQPEPGSTAAGDGKHVVLPVNDLGMHCADLGSYPFNILPPFNTINAYAIKKGSIGANKPLILDASSVAMRYSAASNPNDPVGPGSINSTSQNYPLGSSLADATIRKTDFWDDFQNTGSTIASLLFPGLDPLPDEGLLTLDNIDQGHGRFMPGIRDPYVANDPQAFSKFIPATGWHTAQGIPLTNVDDSGRLNSYPLLRIQAIDNQTGQVLATTDAVAPVSAEVDCRDCHTAGKVGANSTARNNGPQFIAPASTDRLDVELAAKKNILMLHDFKHNTDFIQQDKPVLCAGCHRSNALASVGGPAGDPTIKNMSNVMHGFHGRLQTNANGELLRDFQGEPILIDPPQQDQAIALIPFGDNVPMEENCFLCHPGKVTQCFRGAMYTAGRECDDCHGNLLAMGGEFSYQDGHTREPWAEEPKCGSCHSGIGQEPVATIAYNPADPAAEPLPPKTHRFAENPNTLYRNSLDNHAQLGCESCHGSPHAIWPNRNPDANDNVTAMQLQGHKGTITECNTCHEPGSFPKGTLNGPHGMHPVNDPDWNDEDGHGHFAEKDNSQCNNCHGDDHLGTRLSKTPVDRVLKDKQGKILATLKAGDQVACNLCHSLQKSFSD
ncbi:cytochrome C [methane-oxidizing endosymbiont of Gigantopelta aegis]|uniref:cytochrome C n=2 Tax=methane-oxidizing endosymbiont of Gigantopelta aegis TaxID=2794938 RepID=UPI0018DC39E4|nr:cytochrome C [methane-oxidizing endosymbiont of Gigantopelta aegis]